MPKMISCGDCNGRCCRDVSVEIDEPEDFEDFENIKWMIAHKNVIVYLDNEGDWLVEFATDCKYLDENSRCTKYEERYKVCREHEADGCIMNGDGEIGNVVFRKEEDVDNYMKLIGFYEKYLEEKKKNKAEKP